MEKKIDPWREIASLIGKEKERALAEFLNEGFDPAAAPAIRPVEHPFRLLVHRPVLLATAASILLTVALVSFWLLRGSWQKVPTVPDLDNRLANSFLYSNCRETAERTLEPCPVSPFSSVFSAWAAAAGLTSAVDPAAKPIDASATVEHGDPAAVQSKMEKIIRENVIERMIMQFCQIGKEV